MRVTDKDGEVLEDVTYTQPYLIAVLGGTEPRRYRQLSPVASTKFIITNLVLMLRLIDKPLSIIFLLTIYIICVIIHITYMQSFLESSVRDFRTIENVRDLWLHTGIRY
jgi:hypothetical protein